MALSSPSMKPTTRRRNGSPNDGGPPPSSTLSMPHDPHAERVLLGSILIDNGLMAVALEVLTEDEAAFHMPAHRAIWRSMVALHRVGKPMEPNTLAGELANAGLLESIGGTEALAAIVETVVLPENIGAHAATVFDHWQARELISACQGIIATTQSSDEPIQTVLEAAERELFRVASSRRTRSSLAIDELARDVLDDIERRTKNRQTTSGLPTGFYDLDVKTGGLQKTDLIIVAARPSMGKTAFALNICTHAAMHEKAGVAFFSLEMSAPQLVQRVIATLSRINLHRLRTGRIDPPTMKILAARAAELAQSSLYIDDTPGLTVLELRSKARRLVQRHPNIGLIAIDYLQLMASGRRAESRQQEVSEISRALKELARELKVPVVALSQLSRQSEQRPRKERRPVLSDLRDSGSIEQDADVVMFVHREEYYNRKDLAKPGDKDDGDGGNANKQAYAPEMAEIIIGKQRNGPTGKIDVLFLPDLACFLPAQRPPRSS